MVSRHECGMQDFASGYALGELLSRYNLQPDFAKFDASGTPNAAINNFTRLQPTFQQLGLKLDSTIANDLLREEKGVASHILYRIKQVCTLARISILPCTNKRTRKHKHTCIPACV